MAVQLEGTLPLASRGGSQLADPTAALGRLQGLGAPLKDLGLASAVLSSGEGTAPSPASPSRRMPSLPAALPFNSHFPRLMSYELDVNMPPGEICPLSVPWLTQKRGLD